MKKLVFTVLLALVVALPAFSASKGKKSDANRIVVKAGKTCTISLDSNPTTGYTWQMQNPLNDSLIKVVNKTFTPKSNMAGSPGKEVWQFKGLKKGNVFVTMVYKRSWEKAFLKKKNYTIVIK